MGDGAGDGIHIGVDGEGGELLHDGLERERHVGARIAIGHGEHVELIDLLGLIGHGRHRDGEAGANSLCNHLFWHFRLVNAGLCEQAHLTGGTSSRRCG